MNVRVLNPPTHNREPYDTQRSDTISTDPSVEPMPLRVKPPTRER